jgi:hypothetical protein
MNPDDQDFPDFYEPIVDDEFDIKDEDGKEIR